MKISGLKAGLECTEKQLLQKARDASGITDSPVFFRILKKSLDARDKGDIHYVYTVEIDDKPFEDEKEEIKQYSYPERRVVVVGFGPCGMFAALRLARAGFKPLVLERGSDVETRKLKCNAFFSSGVLDEECNVQFGEGGAGAFSDGKLNSGIKSEYKAFVLAELVKHGAPSEITYLAKPHIGSDILPGVVKSVREEIIALGGEVSFDSKVTDVLIKNGKIVALRVDKGAENILIEVSDVVLAIGHSSRDTYEMLFGRGVAMESKDCAIGVRVEHLQQDINLAQFGKDIGISADYKLATTVNGRGVFSFCMCPGGVVMPSASESGGVVTNGMSEYARDGENANSAIVCQLRQSDYGSGIFSGMELLKNIEKRAYAKGGGEYLAPAVNVTDFIKRKRSVKVQKVKPTYSRGVRLGDIDGVLPDFVGDSIRGAFLDFDRKIKGFAQSGIITAPETRTSSPVRILRASDLQSVTVKGIYPAGEVGFAGGITSSAVDGIRVAEAIKQKYEK